MQRRHPSRVIAAAIIVATTFGPTAHASRGDIWTVGGGGPVESEGGFQVPGGDGGSAVQASLITPLGVAVGGDGTIFVADFNSHSVRAIFADGTIETVAGSTRGFSGDGGAATEAQMWGPQDVALDPAGGLVITDTENDRLRKLWPDGSITTISGGYVHSGGSIGDGGPVLEAKLAKPTGVAFAANGEMYIREGQRVRHVDQTGTITTLTSILYATGDIDVDSQGNVYAPDGDVVWRIDPLGQATMFAGRNGLPGSSADGILATDAELQGTYRVTVAANDDVYFTDQVDGRIRKVSNGIITTVAGGGQAAAATGCRSATRPQHVRGFGLDLAPDGSLVVSIDNTVRVVALTDLDCPSITAVNPTRVLETRIADGQIGYTGTRPTPGQTVVLDLGRPGSVVPADATAVALNLTVTNTATGGYVSAWPCEAEQPFTSNVNVPAGQTAANAVLVSLGASNTVCLFDQAGGDLIVDVTGFIGVDVPYVALVPYRALETRSSQARWQYSGPKPVAGQVIQIPIRGWGIGRIFPTYASAVVLNVTATDATADGYVTVWSCDEPRPTASNLNVTQGGTVAHLVVAQLGTNTSPGGNRNDVCVFTQSGTDLIVDILGAFMPDAPFEAVDPDRVLETRVADGQIGYVGTRPVAGQIVEIDVLGQAGGTVPPNARAVALNVTATNPGTPGYITVWPCGSDRPVSSSLNMAGSDTQSNAVVVGLGVGGKVCVFTQGGADLIADLNGVFT